MSPDTASTARRRNHALWLGPLIVLVGGISYFTVFARFPALRDFPWINLPVVLAGSAISVAGLWRALNRPDVFRGKILGTIGATLSLGLTVLFCGYIFVLSYSLPDATKRTLDLKNAPNFRLATHTGETLELSELRGRKVVLTFYRGFW